MKNSLTFTLLILLSLLAFPFQSTYANLVPIEKISVQTKNCKNRVQQKTSKRLKRQLAKRAPNKSNSYITGIIIVGVAALLLVPTGIILIVAGLTLPMPVLWIVGICIIAGIILIGLLTWLITFITLNNTVGQLS